MTANKLVSLPPADGFSELEKMKAEQSMEDDLRLVQNVPAQSEANEDRRFGKQTTIASFNFSVF